MDKTAFKLSGVAIVLGFLLLIGISCSVKKNVTEANTADTLKPVVTNEPAVDTEYYAMVEKQAMFQNGDVNKYISYLKRNIRYPVYALRHREQGTVIIQFGVDCYGAVKIFSTMKSSGYKILDNEARRIIASSPKWTPAKSGNKSVGQLLVLQIKFDARTRRVEIH